MTSSVECDCDLIWSPINLPSPINPRDNEGRGVYSTSRVQASLRERNHAKVWCESSIESWNWRNISCLVNINPAQLMGHWPFLHVISCLAALKNLRNSSITNIWSPLLNLLHCPVHHTIQHMSQFVSIISNYVLSSPGVLKPLCLVLYISDSMPVGWWHQKDDII